ncbi:hypothetical protein [Campylobacter curvus]|uniref:hypothetical protein n=1 Tax=Campylobacter curvus TaxID=200 RepID=UPI0014701E4B|nr:hypothetical protein [Campylobacter curvus]
MSSYTESEIAIQALIIIGEHPGIRTSELIEKLMAIMRPSGEDIEILAGRSDTKFSQKVRNLKSHDTLKDKVYTIGDKDRQWFLKTYTSEK